MNNPLAAPDVAGKAKIHGSYSRVTIALALLTVVLALLVMTGWHTHNDFLVRLRPDLLPTPYNSALMLMLAGLALLALVYRQTLAIRLLASAGLLFGALTMSQYFTGANLGIDQLLMQHYLATTAAGAPGRMALSSAFCYLLMNTGFLLFTLNQSRWQTRWFASVCASIIIAVVIATMLGYKNNLQPLFGWSATTYMSPLTALGIFMVSMGLLMTSLTTDDIELSEYNHLPMAAAGFIVIATATLLLWSGLSRQHDEQRQAALTANARLVTNSITVLYREHFNTLERMAHRWEAGNGTSEAIWDIDTVAYLDVLQGVSAIAWMDAKGVLQRKKAEAGSALAQWPQTPQSLADSCQRSQQKRTSDFVSPSMDVSNNSHFYLVRSLFPSGRFDGCLVTEFSIMSLFSFVDEQNPGLAYHVDYNGTTVYASEVDHLRSQNNHIATTGPLALTGGGWSLDVSDAGYEQQDVRSVLPAVTLATGLLLSALFSVLLGLWGTSRRHLAEAAHAARALAYNRQQLNQFRTTLDLTLDCVFMFDPRTYCYYYANEGALRITGLSAAEMQGKHPWDINPSLDEAAVRARVIPLTEREVDAVTFDTMIRSANGTETPVECFLQYIAPIGEAPRFVAIMRDITQRKRVEQMKSEFVSTVSHELRTPLTSITGALGLVKGGALGEVSSTMKDMIDIAYQNGRRLTHLINDLLDIERIAAGKISFDFQVQPLMPLVQQALSGISTYGDGNKVEVRLVQSEPGIEVRVDNQRLLQILGNLLSNAIKFSPGEGSVDVSVEQRGPKVRLSVRDYGRGIPEEFKGRIFQKFAQADSSDTRRQSGTGLGLAISRELAERMGGSLAFDSAPGQGACFYLDLPISNYKAEQVPATGPRLLLVEDEPDAALLLQQILHTAGYRTDIATTGKAALAAVREQKYAAMLLDLNLPDMNGIEIIRQLKPLPQYSDMPIIVVSAQAEDGRLRMNGDGVGIIWLPKPVDPSRLLVQLDKLAARTAQSPCRILHVEDDADLHTVIRSMAGKGCEFTLAPTLKSAWDELTAQRFAAVILDLVLPDGSGWDLLPAIRRHQPSAKIIILTGTDAKPPTTNKADSVLLKSGLTPEQLLAALHDRLEPS